MRWYHLILALIALVIVLWVAYNIGKVVLRVAAGLAFLGLLIFFIWHIFTKRTLPNPFSRSQHGHLLHPLRR